MESVQPSSSFQFCQLPDELISKCLESLPALDIAHVSETCHQLHGIATDDFLWSQLVQREFGNNDERLYLECGSQWKSVYRQYLNIVVDKQYMQPEGMFEIISTTELKSLKSSSSWGNICSKFPVKNGVTYIQVSTPQQPGFSVGLVRDVWRDSSEKKRNRGAINSYQTWMVNCVDSCIYNNTKVTEQETKQFRPGTPEEDGYSVQSISLIIYQDNTHTEMYGYLDGPDPTPDLTASIPFTGLFFCLETDEQNCTFYLNSSWRPKTVPTFGGADILPDLMATRPADDDADEDTV